MGRIAEHQGQRFSDLRIASAGKPTNLFRWQVRNVHPQCLDKQDLRQLCQNSFSAGPGSVRLIDGKTDRVFQPSARSIVANVDFEDRRQTAETAQRISKHPYELRYQRGLERRRIAGTRQARADVLACARLAYQGSPRHGSGTTDDEEIMRAPDGWRKPGSTGLNSARKADVRWPESLASLGATGGISTGRP